MLQISNQARHILAALRRQPQAAAVLSGSPEFPDIRGTMLFYETGAAVLVVADIAGLPRAAGVCQSPIFAFHIHSGNSCSGGMDDPFSGAMAHYNPGNCPHPYHAGDMPPLFGCGGYAFQAFLTDRFRISEIIGRTVIIHAKPDDFTTQPSGNSGEKIACGEIRRYR